MNLTVSFGTSNPAAITTVQRTPWETFAEWLTQPQVETPDKTSQGWYCPAEFSPVYRDSQNLVARHAITFDFDRVTLDTWGDARNAWEHTAFAMYTTYSHLPEAPRFRVVMPLSRPAGYDEFQAVARMVAADVGIELVARESFVPAQMMYAPARRLGAAYTTYVNEDREFLDVDSVLAEYADWTDQSSWPRRRDHDSSHLGSGERADPMAKPGIIGAFNRAFSISAAIEKFDLPYARVR